MAHDTDTRTIRLNADLPRACGEPTRSSHQPSREKLYKRLFLDPAGSYRRLSRRGLLQCGGVPFEEYVNAIDMTMSRIRRMFLHCVRGIGLSLRRRLALELLELAASFGAEDRRGTILTVTSTHEDLASSIGASRQKVTQCLASFERRLVVLRDGRRLIVDPHRLREIVEKG
jgi:hypothetical protein